MSTWKTVALGDILELKYGKALKKEVRTGGRVAVVGSSGIVGWNESAIVDEPTLVIGRKGSIGSLTLIDGPSWPIDTAYYTSFDPSRIHLHWLRYQMAGFDLKSLNKAAAVPGLNREDVYRLRTVVPPIAEQRRIASILDEADAIRTKRRAQLTHLDELPQALFQQMFSSSALDSTLADHLSFLTSGSRGWAKYYSEKGVKFLRIQNVKAGRLDLGDLALVEPPITAEALRTRVQGGDILLSITADLGRVAVIPPRFGAAHINQHLALLRAPDFHADFLAAYLCSPQGQQEILGKDRGATKAGLNFDDIRSVRIPTPRLEDQQRFADRIAPIRAERDRVARALEADDELFAALQYRAFRGEL